MRLEGVRDLWSELRRRHVLRVAGSYALVAWIVTQVANIAFPALHLPSWTVTFVVLLSLLGFPIAIVLAWAFEITPQGIRRTPPVSEISARQRIARGVRVVPRPVWIVLVVAAAAWATWSARPRSPAHEPDLSQHVIAVLPFSVHGTERWVYLGEGIVNLLSAKLDGAGDLRSVDPHALLTVTGATDTLLDPQRASDIARRFEAGLYVLGDVLEASQRLRLSASLYTVSEPESALARVTVEGSEGELFELVDELTRRLLAGRSAGPGERLTRLAALTTDSLRALKAHLEGEAEFRAGRFDSAVSSFEHAVTIDPSFALAWYRLSLAAEWSGRRDRALEAASRAAQRAERLTERDRLLIRALRAYLNGDAASAEELYRAILAAHPDDVEAWYQLGEVLFHSNPLRGRPVTEATEPFRRVLSFDGDHLRAQLHLTSLAALDGREAELDSLTRSVLESDSAGTWALPMRAVRTWVLGEGSPDDVVPGLAEADAFTVRAALGLLSCARDFEGARQLAERLTRDPRSTRVQAMGYIVGAHLDAARGRWERAEAQLTAAQSLDPDAALQHRALLATTPLAPHTRAELVVLDRALVRWHPAADTPSIGPPGSFLDGHPELRPQIRLYLMGRVRARLGDREGALRSARELERFHNGAELEALAHDLAWTLRAQVAAADARPTEALAALERIRTKTWHEATYWSAFYSQAHARYLRAQALAELERLPEALRWYHTFSGLSIYELAYLGPSYLRRAEIFQSVHRDAESAKHYARFARLWENADPGLQPIVDGARARAEAVAEDTPRARRNRVRVQ